MSSHVDEMSNKREILTKKQSMRLSREVNGSGVISPYNAKVFSLPDDGSQGRKNKTFSSKLSEKVFTGKQRGITEKKRTEIQSSGNQISILEEIKGKSNSNHMTKERYDNLQNNSNALLINKVKSEMSSIESNRTRLNNEKIEVPMSDGFVSDFKTIEMNQVSGIETERHKKQEPKRYARISESAHQTGRK